MTEQNKEIKKKRSEKRKRKGRVFPAQEPGWNLWQVLLLIALVTLAEFPLGWLETPQNLDSLLGRLHYVWVGLGEGIFYFVLTAILLWRTHRTWKDVGFVRVKGRFLFLGLFTGAFLFISIGLLGNLLTHLLGVPAPQSFTEAVIGAQRPWEFALFLLLAGVVAPLKEEMLFRGLIYPPLRLAYGKGKGILFTGAMFGLLHLDPMRFLPLFLGGVVLTWLYERSGSLWPSILAHGVWNALMAAAVWLQR
ncbi:MAG: CPBP family intramembrane metalloprotease [Desulfitobacteriaceae bacterium]|nr:CPBP family intramembrane metalloprotease [Desulfitobacteriaceae bacterium]MDI6912683.1 CPBP family intramembrane metalloprotease [Desulfitobacteriaceae bacterium]